MRGVVTTEGLPWQGRINAATAPGTLSHPDPPPYGQPDLEELVVLGCVVGRDNARRLIERFGRLRDVALAGDAELSAAGLPARKLRLLRSAVELGTRAAGPLDRGKIIRSAADVARLFSVRLALRPVEEFWAVALDARHRMLRDMLLARGTLTGVDVHPRDVFRELIRVAAAAVIFVHNHPSGEAEPSLHDRELTDRLVASGELIGIAVLDHVVVAPGERYVSILRGDPAA